MTNITTTARTQGQFREATGEIQAPARPGKRPLVREAEEMTPVLASMSPTHDLEYHLERFEQTALVILWDYGVTGAPWDLPRDQRALIQGMTRKKRDFYLSLYYDARALMHSITKLRFQMDEGGFEETSILEAMQAGALAEKILEREAQTGILTGPARVKFAEARQQLRRDTERQNQRVLHALDTYERLQANGYEPRQAQARVAAHFSVSPDTLRSWFARARKIRRASALA